MKEFSVCCIAHDYILEGLWITAPYPRRFLGRVGRTPYRTHSLGDGSKCCRRKGLKTVCIAPTRTSVNKGLAQGEEEKNDPHDNSRDSSSLIYGADFLPHSFFDCHVWSLDRVKVNPKCRLIIFLENPGHSIFPTYSSTSHARIHEKIRHDLC